MQRARMVPTPMGSRVRGALRVLKRVLSIVAILFLLVIVGASIAAYLAVTGRSVAVLRFATTRVGALMAGQRTHQLTLDIRLNPAEGRLTGTARLAVESLGGPRQHFYFLLNDGLRIRNVRVEGSDSNGHAASGYQVWLLAIVDAGKPVPQGGTVVLTLDYEGTPGAAMFSVTSNVFNPHQVLLNVDSFWYPNDVQGAFDADVTVTLPASMTLIHNGTQAEQFERGNARQTHWTSERPLTGLALVAGQYTLSTRDADGVTYRLYLPPDVQLDPARILTLMRDAQKILEERYGGAGFHQITLFVDRHLRRGFNDGSGLLGLSIRYFRVGDYGFGTIAHEIAHNWWGATVAEKWLSPGTGGEWIVEGFSEFSSIIAAEAEYGAHALPRRRSEELFDPDRHGIIARMSVLDNAVAESAARDTIYRKGAYVALMLRQKLGDEAYFGALRQFLERFRLQQVTDSDLQQVLEESSQQDLKSYFADWVRSDRVLDLSLDGDNQAEVTVKNEGTVQAPDNLELWRFKRADAGQPERSTVHAGDRLSMAAEGDYGILDPLLVWADVQRENNRYPRLAAPLYVTASARGDLAVTRGEPYPWVRSAVAHISADGRTLHTWDFKRGMNDPPVWAPDGSRLIASYSDSPDALPAIVSLAVEGSQRLLGYGTAPAPAVDGAVYAGQHERVIRLDPTGSESTLVQRAGEALERPLPSPDGTRIAYTAARGNQVELRVINRDRSADRSLLSWDRDRMVYRWSPDGEHLYTIAGGNWDWQVWDVPIASGSVTALATGAAAIADLAVSPDGTRLAFTAMPDLDYPHSRCRLYVLQLGDRAVRTIDIPDVDLGQLTWVGNDAIVVAATDADADRRWSLPAARTLKHVHLPDGSVEEMP